jgi:hypothetical protein
VRQAPACCSRCDFLARERSAMKICRRSLMNMVMALCRSAIRRTARAGPCANSGGAKFAAHLNSYSKPSAKLVVLFPETGESLHAVPRCALPRIAINSRGSFDHLVGRRGCPTYSHRPFDKDTFLMQNSSQGRPAASSRRLLLRLHLHRLAQLRRCARSDNEIPLRRCAGALRDLPDGADCIDDGGAGGIRHEPSERF